MAATEGEDNLYKISNALSSIAVSLRVIAILKCAEVPDEDIRTLAVSSINKGAAQLMDYFDEELMEAFDKTGPIVSDILSDGP